MSLLKILHCVVLTADAAVSLFLSLSLCLLVSLSVRLSLLGSFVCLWIFDARQLQINLWGTRINQIRKTHLPQMPLWMAFKNWHLCATTTHTYPQAHTETHTHTHTVIRLQSRTSGICRLRLFAKWNKEAILQIYRKVTFSFLTHLPTITETTTATTIKETAHKAVRIGVVPGSGPRQQANCRISKRRHIAARIGPMRSKKLSQSRDKVFKNQWKI